MVSRSDLRKVNSISFSVYGTQYNYGTLDDNFSTIKDHIDNMLNSGKFDISGLFSGKVKMPCDDLSVSNHKVYADIRFEIFIDNGSYKKIFLLWIQTILKPYGYMQLQPIVILMESS